MPSLTQSHRCWITSQSVTSLQGYGSEGKKRPEIRSEGGPRPGYRCELCGSETQENYWLVPGSEPDYKEEGPAGSGAGWKVHRGPEAVTLEAATF